MRARSAIPWTGAPPMDRGGRKRDVQPARELVAPLDDPDPPGKPAAAAKRPAPMSAGGSSGSCRSAASFRPAGRGQWHHNATQMGSSFAARGLARGRRHPGQPIAMQPCLVCFLLVLGTHGLDGRVG
ncbi:hypothetical protein GGTG_14127 [Gaeumannomyces tritici R3-111a-1]|uniref:Uncharacterized protein n=1 Tax=Gaeumannomyces tritici (strain R3-111a-1) TaxID=644352 RepID=J3PKR2_GAET3|nr:hypothetical protein GGTG_14127 [Gaeumannomyces tritici R3-111a-1]EJT68294.1 hypothetical protein GGTG_14127 [Gaeumannomyces tritici R3-111a-1]